MSKKVKVFLTLTDLVYKRGKKEPKLLGKIITKGRKKMAEVAKQENEQMVQSGGSNKLLIIISAVLFLVLIGGGAMAYFMLNSDDEVMQDAQSAKVSKVVKHKSKASDGSARNSDFSKVGPMYALDKFIVNLSSDSGSRYLRTTVNLELSSEEFQAEVDKKKPLIRDIIIRVLSAKSYEEISTIRGKEALKDEIVTELNKVFEDGYVQNIFFTEFVIQ